MKTVTKDGITSVVAQNEIVIPNLTIEDLLSVIPSVASLLRHGSPLTLTPSFRTHCFKRSTLRSSLYV